MDICVCIKQTPDSSSVYIDPITGQVDYERFVQILNPADACAVEAAVRLKEQSGGSVIAITLGPQDAEGALRAALAIGADRALRLWNPQASNWGPFTVSGALAACIQREAPEVDLVLCGDSSSDWSSGIVGPAVAEKLDLPQITGVMQLHAASERGQDTAKLQVTRKLERGYRELLEAHLPVLLTVTGDLNEPRYPSLPAHLAALKATIPIVDPLPLIRNDNEAEADETTILEIHTPRPLPRRIAAPNSQRSAFERIGEIVAGGAAGRKTSLVEGSPEELARTLVAFLRERGFT
ncbi:MAG TPA: electron transfer flavoprotein subunit beta/FixA family protein [Ktedonobacteraceae bacterium]|nr:electron transfer flavoprotein subunit beta/FixA family protein [Ktedonobacteraceae bacterium]